MKPANGSAQNRPGSRRRLLGLLGVATLLAALLVGVSAAQVDPSAGNGPPDGPSGLAKALAAQEQNTDRLLAMDGVVGTAVGLGTDGEPVIKVYTTFAGVPGIPRTLEGISTVTEVTGMFVARVDPTQRFPRPVPIGISTGHPAITAGTIGARVTDGTNVWALSNNHVYANSNDASDGDEVIQPGAHDGGSLPGDYIGTLDDFEPIDFSGGNNTIDAAIASTTTALLGTATPGVEGVDGYGTPNSTTVTAFVGQAVQKHGRTTGWTHGQVTEINVTVDVCYKPQGPFFCKADGIARFVNQIAISDGNFSAGGDSGSLIVTDDASKNAVGLLFAGSSTRTLANPIDAVLNRFNVTIDNSALAPPAPVTDIAVTAVSAPGSAVQGDSVDVDVTVENSGNQDVGSDINVTLTDDIGGDVGTETISGGLAAGASTTLTFSWDTSGASLDDHTLTASHGFGDDDGSNDSQSTTVTVSEPSAPSGGSPAVTACDPGSGNRGARMTVTVNGSNFQDGATVDFGARVNVQEVTFVSSSQLDVRLRVHNRAALGPRDVTVTNPGSQSGTGASCFTVN